LLCVVNKKSSIDRRISPFLLDYRLSLALNTLRAAATRTARARAQDMIDEFHRIKRLPPYVFAEVNAMKAAGKAASA
jgi:hypothetical protein